jgi:hypothetical protein
MKYCFILIFIFLSLISYSQSKTEFGVIIEGAWFTPKPNSKYSEPNRNGWGTGLGIYASRSIFWRFSADAGLLFRYKQMEQHYTKPGIAGTNTGVPYEYAQEVGWKKYALNYVVVPMHLQLLHGKYAFIRGGIEASWLTNYKPAKTEYNWTLGFGSQRYKLKWSVNYIRGFKEVGFKNGLYEMENGKYFSGTFYCNQMLQLSLSYPLWHK